MRKFLLYSSALVAGGLLNGLAEAACIQTPTCSSLGYTSSSACTGGVKCPFGNAWNCTASDLNDKITEQTNKITEIEKKVEDLETLKEVCYIGSILYSDKSCSSTLILGKTPIGVVFDRDKKLAIGLQQSQQYWSYPDYFDVPGLSNITSSSAVTADWQGKNNTRIVLEYCHTNGYSCPAVEYVNSYKTEGTQAGDWYLPAAGELNVIYGNKDVLNITLNRIEGDILASTYWSSSESSRHDAWYLSFNDGDVHTHYKNYTTNVRPVLAF